MGGVDDSADAGGLQIPATPPKPPMRVGTGEGAGRCVRPASDRIASISGRPAIAPASVLASAVPPRIRRRKGLLRKG
jgi:hypothetical protein